MAISESTSQQLNSGKSNPCRRLKVGYRAGSARGNPPHIRIMGRWVEEAGFAVGATVNVDVSHGRLVIELVPPGAEYEFTPPRRAYISERMVMTVDHPSSNVVATAKKGVNAR